MSPAAEKFVKYLQNVNWSNQSIPVIQNYDVASHNDKDAICNALVKQLYSPVRWIETVEFFVAENVTKIIECGPGKVLTGLNKRIAKDVELMSLSDALSVESVVC